MRPGKGEIEDPEKSPTEGKHIPYWTLLLFHQIFNPIPTMKIYDLCAEMIKANYQHKIRIRQSTEPSRSREKRLMGLVFNGKEIREPTFRRVFYIWNLFS